MPLTVWSSAKYVFPLPEGHRFPVAKYALLKERIVTEGIVAPERVLDPEGATDEMLRLVHTEAYVRRVTHGEMSPAEVRRLGFPWSPALVERSRRAVGGTIAATRHALSHGIAMNLAGGTHHAFPDHGEGFCVFNDVAIAIRLLQAEGGIRRAAVIDLDVHQGNGTHAVFAGDRDVYTFSMHGGRNYPFEKVPGTLDIDLPDGVGDDEYLASLERVLPMVLRDARPDLVVYLAGADPHEGDRLGRMKLTFAGLRRRDAMVVQACREVGLPIAVTIAGGYGRDISDTVAVHLDTGRILDAIG